MIPEKEEMQLFQGFKMTTATENFGFLGDTNVRDGRGAPVACPIVMEKGFEFDEELLIHQRMHLSMDSFKRISIF